MQPIIEVKGLSKKYRLGETQPYYTLRDSLAGMFSNPFAAVKQSLAKDEFWALKDINFEVQQGEVVGIIGRNGAGKSTLLKILSQITPPTEGEVILRGRVGSLLEVGTGFSPELTGRENIYLNGAILGMSRAEVKKRFDEIVDFSEVEQFLDTPLKRYSSGMYMRLAFAVAAHLEPEILIVDEVLAVGDAEFQKKCLGKMGEVANEGRTVLFVSHNIDAIKELCIKSFLLSGGFIEKKGLTQDVMQHYRKSLGQSIKHSNVFPVITSDQKLSINDFHWQKNGIITDSFNSEDTIEWKIDISLKSRINQLNIVIAIETDLGVRLVSITSNQSLKASELTIGRHQICGSLNNVNLPVGNYNIAFGVRINNNTEFYNPNFCTLSVHHGHNLFEGQNSLIYTKSKWLTCKN